MDQLELGDGEFSTHDSAVDLNHRIHVRHEEVIAAIISTVTGYNLPFEHYTGYRRDKNVCAGPWTIPTRRAYRRPGT